jgi:tetratricopeptide (TPR) repeat protein
MLSQQEEHAAALPALREAVRLNPDLSVAWHDLGRSGQALGDPQAIDALRESVRLRPGAGLAWCDLAYACVGPGRLNEALEAAREAVRLDAGLVRAWYLRGCLCVDLNLLDEAFASLAQLAAQAPEFFDTGVILGRAYVKKGALPEAIDCYREAVRLAPANVQAWYELGTTCERQGDTASARAAFQEVLCLQPDHAGARERIRGLEPASTLGSDAEWRVGDVVLDLYDVTGILGEGGMGRVYKVHHRGWGVDMAVKTPRPEIFARRGGKEDFVREAETWVDLGVHPNVVSCHYVRTLGGLPRVFAEYVEGGTLEGWIDSGRLYEGGVERAVPRILDVAIQFAWGLHYAHEQGLVHQDVKPQSLDGAGRHGKGGGLRAGAGPRRGRRGADANTAGAERRGAGVWIHDPSVLLSGAVGRTPVVAPDGHLVVGSVRARDVHGGRHLAGRSDSAGGLGELHRGRQRRSTDPADAGHRGRSAPSVLFTRRRAKATHPGGAGGDAPRAARGSHRPPLPAIAAERRRADRSSPEQPGALSPGSWKEKAGG